MALSRIAKAIEEDALDAGMVVKVLHMNGTRNRTAHMKVHARSAMGRERNIVCPAERSSIKESADAAAASAIGLEDGDGLRVEHTAEVPGCIAVFASSNVHSERGAAANLVEAEQIIGADWLLEPADTLLRETVGEFDGLCHRVSAIR